MENTLTCEQLHGKITISGDKSISHRALLLAAISTGVTIIENLSTSQDVSQTVTTLKQLGVRINFCIKTKQHKIFGLGLNCFVQPNNILNMENSGTAARLFIGLLSTYNLNCTITGDESLNKRPMQRILDPLSLMGGQFTYNNSIGYLPIKILANPHPVPINFELPVASAQLKTALMFAALNINGCSTIIENIPTRNHSELLFANFKANINITYEKQKKIITICGKQELQASNIKIPGDFSSAAFLIVVGLLVPNSHIIIENVGINPTRIGLLNYLIKMGANIKLYNHQKYNNEELCTIEVQTSQLKAICVLPEHNAIMIDEFPILAIAASLAEGKTSFLNVKELKYKESNRLNVIAEALKRCNVKCEIENDNLHIWGTKAANIANTTINTYKDHRIAMSFLILALSSKKDIYVDDISMINTSFKEFFEILQSLGAKRKYE